MKEMRFKGGTVRNDSPIGELCLDRRAKASELVWLSRVVEASGLDLDEIVSIEGFGSVAFIERTAQKVVLTDA